MLDMSTKIIQQGFLHKKSLWLGTFRERWTILTPELLLFYKANYKPQEFHGVNTDNTTEIIELKHFKSIKRVSVTEGVIIFKLCSIQDINHDRIFKYHTNSTNFSWMKRIEIQLSKLEHFSKQNITNIMTTSNRNNITKAYINIIIKPILSNMIIPVDIVILCQEYFGLLSLQFADISSSKIQFYGIFNQNIENDNYLQNLNQLSCLRVHDFSLSTLKPENVYNILACHFIELGMDNIPYFITSNIEAMKKIEYYFNEIENINDKNVKLRIALILRGKIPSNEMQHSYSYDTLIHNPKNNKSLCLSLELLPKWFKENVIDSYYIQNYGLLICSKYKMIYSRLSKILEWKIIHATSNKYMFGIEYINNTNILLVGQYCCYFKSYPILSYASDNKKHTTIKILIYDFNGDKFVQQNNENEYYIKHLSVDHEAKNVIFKYFCDLNVVFVVIDGYIIYCWDFNTKCWHGITTANDNLEIVKKYTDFNIYGDRINCNIIYIIPSMLCNGKITQQCITVTDKYKIVYLNKISDLNCTGKHGLTASSSDGIYHCDLCGVTSNPGDRMYECRKCNVDVCVKCDEIVHC
eukprot:91391_1